LIADGHLLLFVLEPGTPPWVLSRQSLHCR
jgi:hypothetical protein